MGCWGTRPTYISVKNGETGSRNQTNSSTVHFFAKFAAGSVTSLTGMRFWPMTHDGAPVQSIVEMHEILSQANKRGKAVKVEPLKPVDSQTRITGRAFEISESGFTITDSKTGATTRLSYTDVRQVRQKGMSKAIEVLLGVGIVFGVGIAIFLAVNPKT